MSCEISKFCVLLKKSGLNPRSIIDIGAHNGATSLNFRHIWPESKILMIEANQEHEPSLNRLANLYPRNLSYKMMFAGKSKGPVSFFKTKLDNNKLNSGNSAYRENTEEYSDQNILIEELQSICLDDLGINADFINIDVQGAELDVISGGRQTIQQAKCLIIETSVSNYNLSAPNQDEVISELKKLNFSPITKIEVNYRLSTKIQETLLFLKN